MRKITLVWSDGTTETVVVEDYRIADGILTLIISRNEYRRIPLPSLREWRDER